MAFDNKSSEFSLGDIVYNRLSNAFRDDGRLRLVTQQPDCLLEGSTNSFSEKIYSYDESNNVQDYIVVISFSVTFTDLINNKVLYENKNLQMSEIYASSSDSMNESTSRFKTKDEAINEICDKLFKAIMQNTLESW